MAIGLLAVVMCLESASAGPAPASPPADFLEFLGTFETSQGKELDPMVLAVDAKVSSPQKDQIKPEKRAKKVNKRKGRRL